MAAQDDRKYITVLENKLIPKKWICPNCKSENLKGKYADEIFIEHKKCVTQCENCGYLHFWELKLTEDFKKKVIDMLVNGKL